MQTSREKFIEELSNMVKASISVIFVRSREPYRTIEIIQDYTQGEEKPFKVWNSLKGWETYDADDIEQEPSHDDVTSIMEAIGMVGNKENLDSFPRRGIYVMLWPQAYVNDQQAMPDLVQYLASYTRSLVDASVNKRLIMVVPTGYKLPKELEDCVPVLDFDPPTQGELEECFLEVNDKLKDKSNGLTYNERDVQSILSAGAGMTYKEFEDALYRVLSKHKALLPNIPIDTFSGEVSKLKSQMLKKSDVLELMPTGTMNDIGGLDNLKEWVTLRREAFTKEAREAGVDKPKGLAMFGVPGSGKSAAAKAIAHSLNLPLIKFDVSKVFNHLVGASESRVRDTLQLLVAIAPCVVMMDEVDKMFDINSGGGDSGVGKRILGNILTFMQETEADIFWVMTGNRVEGLPPELLRKGRLDEVFSVTSPNEEEREEILRIHLSKRKEDYDAITGMDRVVTASSGYVGAEIEAAVAEAKLISFSNKQPLSAELIITQFENTKPIALAHKEQFDKMAAWAIDNARAASKGEPAPTPTVRHRDRPKGSPSTGRVKRELDTSRLDG